LATNGYSWLTNPHVCWRHPVPRILVAWLILVLDMFLYGEDPVNDSHVECNLPGLGHMYVFLLVWPSSVGLIFLRIALLLSALVFGMWFGVSCFHHRLLRDCCGLEMFSGSNGTWLVMGLSCAGTAIAGGLAYNLILISQPEEQITGATGFEIRTFGKIAQITSVSADLVAILMVTDAVLQDRTHYPRWAPRLKWLWIDACGGWVRILVIWCLAATGVSLTFWGILSTGKDPDDFVWNDRRFGGLTENGRAAVMSAVIFCDIFTVLQDWQFPSFALPMDIPLDEQVYIAGMWVTEINCNCLQRCAQYCCSCLPSLPRCCRCCPCLWKLLPDLSLLRIRITGPWLTYGPLLVVMCIDLFCTRTQLIYSPESYGQYVDPREHQIWTILDEAYLQQAYDRGALREAGEAMVTYAARRNATTGVALSASAAGDVMLNSRFTSSSLKYLAAAPGFMLMVLFVILVWAANKRRTLLIRLSTIWIGATGLFSTGALSKRSASCPKVGDATGDSNLEGSTEEEKAKETTQEPPPAEPPPVGTAWASPDP